VTGQYLREDADPVMIVAELSKVWISGEVKEKDLRFIKNGDQVSVKVILIRTEPLPEKYTISTICR
jgi:cobalt-zinc-cadmium efflux system membrane fusion protein